VKFGVLEWLTRPPFKARKAVIVVTLSTTTIVLIGALAMTVFDNQDVTSYSEGLWWAVQTITTVGYGDVPITKPEGRVIGALVMISGIGLASVVTATVASAFFVSAQRRRGAEDPVLQRLDDIARRLERVERRLSEETRS
jgi:voltage-gated potassium channel